jgi:protein arginine kinase activator
MSTCDRCSQPAIYHDVRIVDGVHSTTHLCVEHALEAGVNLGTVDVSVILHTTEENDGNETAKACPDCGMTIYQYKQKSLLGCSTCYKTFDEELNGIISKVQDNNVQHIGRAPTQTNVDVDRNIQIRRLLKQLESAVHKEEYEQAAFLRDQLRELHDSGNHYEN